MKLGKRIVSLLLCFTLLITGITFVPSKSLAEESTETLEIVMDDQDAERHGTWLEGSSREGAYGGDYLVGQRDGSGNTWIKWTPQLPCAGDYRVYYRQPEGLSDAQSIASSAPYTVCHGLGEEVIRVNQRKEGGEWELLGTFSFEKEGGYVKLSTNVSENNTLADAVKFEYVPETSLWIMRRQKPTESGAQEPPEIHTGARITA